MSKEIYVGNKSSRQGYWTSFETNPHLTITKRNIYGQCVPCLENLLQQLGEGKKEIELKKAFNCWKAVAVLKDEKECLGVLERYEQRSPPSRYVRGRFDSKEENGTKAVIFHIDGEKERDEILSELEQCAKSVNPKARVFYSRACAYLFEELLGDWKEWKKITPIKYPQNVGEIIRRLKKSLYDW